MRRSWRWEDRVYFKGGSSGGSTTSTVQQYSPEEAANRAKVQNEASRIYDATSGTIANSPYTGSQVVPFSADTLTGQNYARAAAGAQAGMIPGLAQATNFGLNGAMNVNSNPYLQAAMDASNRQITQSYTDPNGVMAQIRAESMGNGGQGTSSRQGIAEGIAAGRYANAIADSSAKMASDAYGQGLDTMVKTLGLSPNTMQAMQSPAQIYSAVGAQNEGLAQAQEDYNAASRNWDLNSQWMPLQNWANIVYGGSAPIGSTSTTSGGTRSNVGMGLLGGAMSGYQLGSMIPGMGIPGAIGGAILGGLFS